MDTGEGFWTLRRKMPIIVGTVGDLGTGRAGFWKTIGAASPQSIVSRQIYGEIWDRDLGTQIAKPEFVSNLKLLASLGLVLEGSNPIPL